jgi:hypothetical protein
VVKQKREDMCVTLRMSYVLKEKNKKQKEEEDLERRFNII